jgi:hypothetical protein
VNIVFTTSGLALSPMMMLSGVRGSGSCPIRTNTSAVSMMLSQSIAENIRNQGNMLRKQGVRVLKIESRPDEMKSSVQYNLMQAGEEQEVLTLVIRVFNGFVAHQYYDYYY